MLSDAVLRIYLVLHVAAILITIAFSAFAGADIEACTNAPSWACGSPLEGLISAVSGVNLSNPLTMLRLIPGALLSIFQLAILNYHWLPTDGLLSVPVYAIRAYSAVLLLKAIINVATTLAGAVGGALGKFI